MRSASTCSLKRCPGIDAGHPGPRSFLELRVAFWTAAVSSSQSSIPFPAARHGCQHQHDFLFGFIVTLGIVDDAAGEEIFHNMSKGMGRMEAAIQGVRRMTTPVIFAVATNIIAFLPLLFVPGETGQFFYLLPAVIAVFTVSLIECLPALPIQPTRGKT